MKIIYLSGARLPTEKAHGLQIMKTCEALEKRGEKIVLLVPRRRNSMREDPFSYYGLRNRFPLRRLFTIDVRGESRVGFLVQQITFALAAAFALRGERHDVIYSRDEILLATLWLCGYRRFVWESHMGAWNLAARLVVRRAAAITVISQGLKDYYISKGIDAAKLTVVPSAIDLQAFAHAEDKAAARKRFGLPENAKIALYIGRLDGWKGTDTLLAASRLLDPIRVALIGGEPAHIAALRFSYPDVFFLGHRPYSELPDNQALGDVLVVPNTGKDVISAQFTSPLKLVAHLASDRPIVASDLPAIREIAGTGEAYLVPADDAEALASGVKKVLDDEHLAKALTETAKKRAEKYTWQSRAQSIAQLCHALDSGSSL